MAVYTITNIKVGNDIYNLKDATIGGVMHFVGKTTTALTDGATTKPIVIDGNDYNQNTGDVVITSDDHKEFVWDGSKWELLGDESSYAIKGTYTTSSVTYTPAGTNSAPTFYGSKATISVSGIIGHATGITINSTLASGHDFTGQAATISSSGTYTPAGTNSAPTFYGSKATISVSGTVFVTTGVTVDNTTPTLASGHTFAGTKATITSTGAYTPSGTISKPAITVTPSTTSVVPSFTQTGHVIQYDSTTESLVFPNSSYLSSVNPATAVNVVTGFTKLELATTPTFYGTSATLSVSATYTPAGAVKVPHTLTGGDDTLTFTGEYTPSGTIAKPTFTGTAKTVNVSAEYTPAGAISGKHELTGAADTYTFTGEYTPAGTISKPIFTGTAATHDHSVTI